MKPNFPKDEAKYRSTITILNFVEKRDNIGTIKSNSSSNYVYSLIILYVQCSQKLKITFKINTFQ